MVMSRETGIKHNKSVLQYVQYRRIMNKRHNRASQIHRTDMTRADKVPIHLRAGIMALQLIVDTGRLVDTYYDRLVDTGTIVDWLIHGL